MSVFDWWIEKAEAAFDDPDSPEDVVQMHGAFSTAFEVENGPTRKHWLEVARELAENVDDRAMIVWIDVWMAQVLDFMGDVKSSYDMLVRLAIEARDPQLKGTPMPVMANNLLVSRASTIDPHGYRGEIQSAAQFLESQCEPESEHACIYYATFVKMYYRVGELESAKAYLDRRMPACQSWLRKTGDDSSESDGWFYMGYQYLLQAHLALLNEDWDEMLANADAGLVPEVDNPPDRATLLAQRAAALARQGETQEAEAAYRRVVRFKLNGAEVWDCYNDAITEYWLAVSRLDQAVEARLNQHESCVGKGRTWEQACSALHLIELYQQLDDHANADLWKERLGSICSELRKPLHEKFTTVLDTP